MFRIEFYDELTKHLVSPWWMYFLIGLNFIFLAVLIFVFPEFLSLLVGSFMLVNGLIFLVVAVTIYKTKRRYSTWKKRHTIPIN